MGSGRRQGDTETQTLTHRRAEVEPLLAWADMISMKALEVSENFLMSTGLGTLQGEKKEGQKTRGASESSWSAGEAGQSGAALAQSLREPTLSDTQFSAFPWHLSSLPAPPSPQPALHYPPAGPL